MNEVSKDNVTKQYLQIGKQLSSLICIDLENGEIIILRTKIKKNEFVNSGILELAELTIIFDEVYDKFRENKINRKSKKEVETEVDYLISEVKRVDTKAISTETVWVEMIDVVKKLR